MWTRPAERASSYGACGQALEKLALPHRLPTLDALVPTSSPLLQRRFIKKATAPAGSRIAPSSHPIRLRNKPANSRGGSTRKCEKQQGASDACRHANVADRSLNEKYGGWKWGIHECRDGHVHTAPVGTYVGNGYGLHDVLGNVWEWVEDCWNGSYAGAPVDGGAWTRGDCDRRVLRGGSWGDAPRFVHSANRGEFTTGFRSYFIGFRVARTLD